MTADVRPELRAAIRELAEERKRLPGGAAPDLIAAKWELTPGETEALVSGEAVREAGGATVERRQVWRVRQGDE